MSQLHALLTKGRKRGDNSADYFLLTRRIPHTMWECPMVIKSGEEVLFEGQFWKKECAISHDEGRDVTHLRWHYTNGKQDIIFLEEGDSCCVVRALLRDGEQTVEFVTRDESSDYPHALITWECPGMWEQFRKMFNN